MKKVISDTNVLVSALLFGGNPEKLIARWKSRIQTLISRDIVGEYPRVLAYHRFLLTDEKSEYLFSQELLPWFKVIMA